MKQHQLGGQIGTDPNFIHATHTGHSRAHVKHSDAQSQFILTDDEQEIMDGKKGALLQKSIKTVVAYGQLFGATRLVDLDCAPHMAMSWGSDGVEPFLKIYRQTGRWWSESLRTVHCGSQADGSGWLASDQRRTGHGGQDLQPHG